MFGNRCNLDQAETTNRRLSPGSLHHAVAQGGGALGSLMDLTFGSWPRPWDDSTSINTLGSVQESLSILVIPSLSQCSAILGDSGAPYRSAIHPSGHTPASTLMTSRRAPLCSAGRRQAVGREEPIEAGFCAQRHLVSLRFAFGCYVK